MDEDHVSAFNSAVVARNVLLLQRAVYKLRVGNGVAKRFRFLKMRLLIRSVTSTLIVLLTLV